MHLDFASALNLVSTVTLIGALVFTGLQVRAANRARREQAAVTVIETAALSETERRKRTGHDEFLEWCEWLATQIAQYRAKRPYVPAYSRVRPNVHSKSR